VTWQLLHINTEYEHLMTLYILKHLILGTHTPNILEISAGEGFALFKAQISMTNELDLRIIDEDMSEYGWHASMEISTCILAKRNYVFIVLKMITL